MRHSLSTLAYIDVGSDNGGIVLNLTEDGMAFQAVAPLEGQQEVSLRIQLPNSVNRIETTAKIVWLSESNRQAGVRFLDLSPADRAQILDWIHSQTAPSEAGDTEPFEPFAPRKGPEELPQKKAPVRETRTDKWLSLMADLQLPEVEPSKPEPAGTTSTGKISLRELSARLQASQASPQHPVENTESTTVSSAPSVRVPEPAPQSPIEPPRSAFLDRAEVSHASPSFLADPQRQSDAFTSSVASARDAFGAPSQALPSITHGDPWHADPWSAAPAATAFASPVARTSTFTSSVARMPIVLKWAAAIVAFAVLAVLAFALGAWISSLGAPAPRPQAEPSTEVAPPTTSSSVQGTNDNTRQDRRAISKKTRTVRLPSTAGQRSGNRAPVSAPPQGPAVVQPTPTQVPSPQSGPSAPTTHGASETSSGTVIPSVKTTTAPPEKPSVSPPSSTPDSSFAFDSAPRVVAGRVLRPTDRFIPSHLLYTVEPIYPLEAKQKGIEGTVKIRLSVSADGTVHNIQLVEGPPILIPAALDAAQYWRYMPALLNGQPIETEQDIEINFHLPH